MFKKVIKIKNMWYYETIVFAYENYYINSNG